MSVVRVLVKRAFQAAALVCAAPIVALYYVKASMIGRDAALHGSTQALSLVPGLPGRYLRVAFLRCVLAECAASACVEFGTIFSKAGARLGENVYIGPYCQIGLAIIGADVLVASGVHVTSGSSTHGIDRLDVPIREQAGSLRPTRIGLGSWIGSCSVVMADVGEHSVIGAGSVVAKPIAPYSIAAGVPARIVRDRRAGAAGETPRAAAR